MGEVFSVYEGQDVSCNKTKKLPTCMINMDSVDVMVDSCVWYSII